MRAKRGAADDGRRGWSSKKKTRDRHDARWVIAERSAEATGRPRGAARWRWWGAGGRLRSAALAGVGMAKMQNGERRGA